MNKKILDVLEYFKKYPHRDKIGTLYSEIEQFIDDKSHYEVDARNIFMNKIYGTREYAESFLLIS